MMEYGARARGRPENPTSRPIFRRPGCDDTRAAHHLFRIEPYPRGGRCGVAADWHEAAPETVALSRTNGHARPLLILGLCSSVRNDLGLV